MVKCVRILTFLIITTASSVLGTTQAEAISLTVDNFGMNGVRFNKTTTVDFKFIESHGKAKSNFGIYSQVPSGNFNLLSNLFEEIGQGYDEGSDDITNDWLGTTGKTIAKDTASFTFKAGQTYFFGLTNNFIATTAYSQHSDFTVFKYGGSSYTYKTQGPQWLAQNPETIATKTLTIAPDQVLIGMNDSYDPNKNINDFLVTATVKSVPEPSAIVGLVIMGGISFLKLRRSSHISS